MAELEANTWYQQTFVAPAVAGAWGTISIVIDDGPRRRLASEAYGDLWHMWRLVEGDYELIPLGSTVPPAQGHWFRHKPPLPPQLKTAESPRPTFDDRDAVRLDVAAGWSMVGNPFSAPVLPRADIAIYAAPVCAAGCTFDAAVDAGLVRDRLWRWTTREYVDLLETGDPLLKGNAMWVRALAPIAVEIGNPVP